MNTQTLLPQLRFPNFKQVWRVKKLGDITTNKSLKYNPKVDKRYFKCIELEHLGSDSGCLVGYTDGRNVKSVKNIFTKNAILYSKLRPYLKKYYLCDFDGICSAEIWVLTTRNIAVSFLYALIQHNRFNYVVNLATGTKMPRADWKVLSKTTFLIPPSFLEQQKIGIFLRNIDQQINNLNRRLVLWQVYKKGILQQFFSQQLRFKQADGSHYPAWKQKQLHELLTYEQPTKYIVSNTQYNSTYLTPVLTAGKTFILGYTNETWGICAKQHPIIIFDDFTTASKYVNFKFKVKSSAMKLLHPALPNINMKFVFEAMQLIKFRLLDHKRYWIAEYQHLKIPFPAAAEQEQISRFLSNIDHKINHLRTRITTVKQFKKGLLQQLFA